jgi:hypothetical protein
MKSVKSNHGYELLLSDLSGTKPLGCRALNDRTKTTCITQTIVATITRIAQTDVFLRARVPVTVVSTKYQVESGSFVDERPREIILLSIYGVQV